MSTPVPAHVQLEAALEVNDRWHQTLVAKGLVPNLVRLVFDYDVSLAMWRDLFGPLGAGEEFFKEDVTSSVQPIDVYSVHSYLTEHSMAAYEFQRHARVHTDEHYASFDVGLASKTLAFELVEAHPAAYATPTFPNKLHSPIPILRLPLVLLRIFDRLLLALRGPTSQRAGAPHTHSTAEALAALERGMSASLARDLRNLRVLFECGDEVRALRPGAHEDRCAELGGFVDEGTWRALAHAAGKLEWIGLWRRDVSGGQASKLQLLLTHERIARAQAAVERGWWKEDVDEHQGDVSHHAGPPTVAQLEERNARAWTRAWSFFETFCEIVAAPTNFHEAHSHSFHGALRRSD